MCASPWDLEAGYKESPLCQLSGDLVTVLKGEERRRPWVTADPV